jgi:hypothetical protein
LRNEFLGAESGSAIFCLVPDKFLLAFELRDALSVT